MQKYPYPLPLQKQDSIYKHASSERNSTVKLLHSPQLAAANLASKLVLGNERSVELGGSAQHVLDVEGADNLGGADREDGVGEDGDTDEARNAATESTDNVDVVVAALGAEGDAVELACSEAEQAGGGLELGEEAGGQRSLDVGSDSDETESVGVEDDDGLSEGLDEETGESGGGGTEGGADLGGQGDVELDVEVDAQAQGRDLSLDLSLGAEGKGLDGGLAPGVRGIVLCELDGRDGAEGAEGDGRARGGALGHGPSADEGGAGAGLAVEALAGQARAGLCPGAVGHGGRALEAGGEAEGGVDVGGGLGDDLVGQLDVGGGCRAGWAGGGGGHGDGGQRGDGGEEMHCE